MTLTWNAYQQQALTTAIYPLKREVEYTVLGLVSEVAEIAEYFHKYSKRDDEWFRLIKAEVGDSFWYVAALADALKFPLEDIALGANRYHYKELEAAYSFLVQGSGYLAGLTKKAIRDDNGFLTEDRRRDMASALGTICWVLDNICDRLGTSRYAVMNDNLNKLSDRKQRGVLGGSGDLR